MQCIYFFCFKSKIVVLIESRSYWYKGILEIGFILNNKRQLELFYCIKIYMQGKIGNVQGLDMG